MKIILIILMSLLFWNCKSDRTFTVVERNGRGDTIQIYQKVNHVWMCRECYSFRFNDKKVYVPIATSTVKEN